MGSDHAERVLLRVRHRARRRGLPQNRLRADLEVLDEVNVDPAAPFEPIRGSLEYIASVRETYPRAYEKWSEDEDAAIRFFHLKGSGVDALASAHERQPSAMVSRLRMLGLID